MDIDDVLNKAPAMIGKLAEDAEESRFVWKNEEIQLKQMEAKRYLEHKATTPDLTQGDLKAKVERDDDIYEKRMMVLTMESAYKKALIDMEKWTNAFVSARKIASIKIDEWNAQNDSVKGGQNER